MKFLTYLIGVWYKLTELFSDDEPYDPEWMDRNAWSYSRM